MNISKLLQSFYTPDHERIFHRPLNQIHEYLGIESAEHSINKTQIAFLKNTDPKTTEAINAYLKLWNDKKDLSYANFRSELKKDRYNQWTGSAKDAKTVMEITEEIFKDNANE